MKSNVLVSTAIILLIFFSAGYGQSCEDRFDKSVDKFKETTLYRLKPTSEVVEAVSLVKGLAPAQGNYPAVNRNYLSIIVHSNTVNVNKKGAIVLLASGKKLLFPDTDIDVKVDRYTKDYEYSTLVNLGDDQITLLKSSPITGVQLYIYEASLKKELGENIMASVACLNELK